jgi:DNA invertase Pin-like site-specific DNA recombinase
MSTKIGYARVSTEDQSLGVQHEQLRSAGCKRIFEERVSGKAPMCVSNFRLR